MRARQSVNRVEGRDVERQLAYVQHHDNYQYQVSVDIKSEHSGNVLWAFYLLTSCSPGRISDTTAVSMTS